MNRKEFNAWMEDAYSRWPSLRSWMHEGTASIWFSDNLQSLDIDLAMEANRELYHQGDRPRWELDNLARDVARKAWEIRQRREPRDQPEDRLDAMVETGPMARSMARLLRAKTDEQRRAILNRAFPSDDEHEPRYRCRKCRDSGHVTCFARTALRDAMAAHEGQIEWDKVRLHTCAVPCSCRSGEPYATLRIRGEPRQLPRFCGRCVAVKYLSRDDRIAQLQLWAEDYRPPNFSPELAAFAEE